jgi:LysM repeat protein
MIYRRSLRPFVLLSALFCLSAYGAIGQDLVHQVAKGETVYSISRLYQISQEELMRYNKIADASKLQAGMQLAIPPRASSVPVVSNNPPPGNSAAYSTYTVSKSDTLYSIARARGVTLQALRDINGFPKNYVLKAGEKIKIPGSGTAAAATAATKAPTTTTPPANAARTAVKKADASIRWPVAAKEVSYMSSNSGVLVSGRMSESIKSLTGGIVVHAAPWRGYGNVAVVEAEGGYRYLYGSCESLSVRKGDSIEPGTELGKLGIYPASGKPELVLIVSQNGSPVDPAKAPRF